MLRAMTLLCVFALISPAFAEVPKMPAPMTAGPAHAGFVQLAGTWDVAQTMYMDGKTMKAKGKQVSRTVLGGLGIAYDYESQMGPGVKFMGHGFQTWAPALNKYESYWFDSFSFGGSSHGWATWDKKTKTMDEVMVGPGPDGKPMTLHAITKVLSKDKMTMVMYSKGADGKEVKMMEMVYTRAK